MAEPNERRFLSPEILARMSRIASRQDGQWENESEHNARALLRHIDALEAKHAEQVRELEERLSFANDRNRQRMLWGERSDAELSKARKTITELTWERDELREWQARSPSAYETTRVGLEAELAELRAAHAAEIKTMLALADERVVAAAHIEAQLTTARDELAAIDCRREELERQHEEDLAWKQRAEKAESALAEASATIHEIADALGYVNWADDGRFEQIADDKLIEKAREARRESDQLHEARETAWRLSDLRFQDKGTIAKLTAELVEARADVVAAAGKLLVPIPKPGTDGSRIMLANVAMRRERDLARKELAEARATIEQLREQSESWRRGCVAWQDWAAELLTRNGLQLEGGLLGDGPARETLGAALDCAAGRMLSRSDREQE